jgi:transposase
MMGRQTADQGALFYEFRLEDRVLETHLLRRSNAVIAAVLASLHKDLAPYYSSTDPELMIRMLIVGYRYGIRFERRLCEEVSLNLAYRWLPISRRTPPATQAEKRFYRFFVRTRFYTGSDLTGLLG